MKHRGLLSRHTDDELWSFCNDDLKAISDMLGENNQSKYFLGSDRPTLADCAVFGHVSQFLWMPLDFPQKKFLHDECSNLVRFMEDFRTDFWPDWDELCEIRVPTPGTN